MITESYLAEILIRLRKGEPVAAQVQREYFVFDDDGVQVGYSLSEPKPAGEDGSDFPIAKALGDEIAERLRTFSALNSKLANTEAALLESQEENKRLRKEIARLQLSAGAGLARSGSE